MGNKIIKLNENRFFVTPQKHLPAVSNRTVRGTKRDTVRVAIIIEAINVSRICLEPRLKEASRFILVFYTIQNYNALHLLVDFNSLLVLKFKLHVLTNKNHLKYSFIICISIGFDPADIIDDF